MKVTQHWKTALHKWSNGKEKSIKVYYLVLSPRAAIITPQRRGIDGTTFSVTLASMLSHDSKIATFNSSKFLHDLVSTFFITSQRYSVGFRSGLCDGHGLTDTLFLSSQNLVLFAL